ncbi:helix-turn-helix domain-containing protein [Pseudactinotalea sp. Z1748]|uniref:helix-turn-helix domain-containing protein n=1 Tax=Pseudactinotalea sp. Z1748 TaxID=3413027 RepID=UPI003C7C5BB4
MARRRMSQTALAKALPLSQAALSRRLCGRVSFSLHELEGVAGVLQVHPSELFGAAFTHSIGGGV